MRLDNYLVAKGLAESRSKAQYYIKSGVIKVNDFVVKKNSHKVSVSDEVIVISNPCIYVSKGGLKLEHAIKEFKLDFTNKEVLDIGASTGGFTDCALKHGAKKVYAVDVGHDQLHKSLCNNVNIINYEGINLKDLTRDMFEKIDIAIADVSFISLVHVFKILTKLLASNSPFIALIKPQFEAGKRRANKGVIKHAKEHIRILQNVINEAGFLGFKLINLTSSPNKGQSGNIEFLAHFIYNKEECFNSIDVKEIVSCAHKLHK
ncbi:TlyA family RNA methyltransferase [Clostridium sp. 'deep sea']|uniref:TlyA family RNA methyltransferase n=1 Tax=Clostridium sp. 'deep sea' TaxID=2779445 RepID=UPI001896988B|nr:TlyA family RNA methyltransferase [Clostridium sp. 'deep sea']QOR35844.1 TlyA family RNA methyltransferase [Clostridium sp. 'deep sea']